MLRTESIGIPCGERAGCEQYTLFSRMSAARWAPVLRFAASLANRYHRRASRQFLRVCYAHAAATAGLGLTRLLAAAGRWHHQAAGVIGHVTRSPLRNSWAGPPAGCSGDRSNLHIQEHTSRHDIRVLQRHFTWPVPSKRRRGPHSYIHYSSTISARPHRPGLGRAGRCEAWRLEANDSRHNGDDSFPAL